MAEQYLNQAAAEWARRNLAREIEIELRQSSWPARVVVALAMLFLGVIFFGIPAILLFNAAAKFVAHGWSAEVSKSLRLGIFFLAGFGGLVIFLFFYVRALRRRLVRFLGVDGVTTRGGGKYRWENLQYLDYVTVRWKVSRNNFLLRAVTNLILAGVERVKVEMFFTDGTATLAPLIENQREMLDLMDTIPARRKFDGKTEVRNTFINGPPD
jgi:hypothetical protein